MKDFFDLNAFFRRFIKKFAHFTDKLSFINLFLLWLIVVSSFGFFYHFFQGDTSYLSYPTLKSHVQNLPDALYFSFVAATTTGFGDIVPIGLFKLIATFEVIFGLLLIALVTSKLVSIKQDVILSELYDLSFDEKLNKLRSSLLLFRQNLERVINKIDEGNIRKREISNLHVYLSSLEDSLRETFSLITRVGRVDFIKNIDLVNTELIFNSIIHSFEKVYELSKILNEHHHDWKNDAILNLLETCTLSNEELFIALSSSTKLREETITDLNMRKNKVIEKIKNELKPTTKQGN